MRIGIDAHLLTYRHGMGNYVYNLFTELDDAIRVFLTYDERAIAMGREGQQLIETRFSLEQMIAQTRQVYDDLL